MHANGLVFVSSIAANALVNGQVANVVIPNVPSGKYTCWAYLNLSNSNVNPKKFQRVAANGLKANVQVAGNMAVPAPAGTVTWSAGNPNPVGGAGSLTGKLNSSWSAGQGWRPVVAPLPLRIVAFPQTGGVVYEDGVAPPATPDVNRPIQLTGMLPAANYFAIGTLAIEHVNGQGKVDGS